jgi:putative transposase
MARLPRLVLPGHAHLVLQRVLPGCRPLDEAADRELCLAALREALAAEPVRLHAFGLRSDELLLVLTPAEAPALARTLQALGRRFVGAFNRRHGRSGTLWDGRFRSALLEPGAAVLQALLLADSAGGEATQSSAAHHLGQRREPWLHDPAELWQLGNTPFERERAWGERLAQGLGGAEQDALRRAALGGWVHGSPPFVAALAAQTERPLRPRARGRPRRTASARSA